MRPRGNLPPIATVPDPPSRPAQAESHSTAMCIAYHCNLRQPGRDGMSPLAVHLALTIPRSGSAGANCYRVLGVIVGESRATGAMDLPPGSGCGCAFSTSSTTFSTG
ncbi:hypothetical protein LA080_001203 [Diaporthe eres]|nr:hypothetical protein LA080_001203 [Diaporthe eres]